MVFRLLNIMLEKFDLNNYRYAACFELAGDSSSGKRALTVTSALLEQRWDKWIPNSAFVQLVDHGRLVSGSWANRCGSPCCTAVLPFLPMSRVTGGIVSFSSIGPLSATIRNNTKQQNFSGYPKLGRTRSSILQGITIGNGQRQSTDPSNAQLSISGFLPEDISLSTIREEYSSARSTTI